MKKELKILLTAYCFSTFAFSMLSPIYAIFVEEIGGGILEASYAIAIFTFISGLYPICNSSIFFFFNLNARLLLCNIFT